MGEEIEIEAMSTTVEFEPPPEVIEHLRVVARKERLRRAVGYAREIALALAWVYLAAGATAGIVSFVASLPRIAEIARRVLL